MNFYAWMAARNLTGEALFVAFLAMVIVEWFRIIGRQSDPNVPRTEFDWNHYIRQGSNWASLVINILCAVLLLMVRDGFVSSIGLKIADEGDFELFYAAGVGAMGQMLVKVLFKAIAGMFGAYGRAEK